MDKREEAAQLLRTVFSERRQERDYLHRHNPDSGDVVDAIIAAVIERITTAHIPAPKLR